MQKKSIIITALVLVVAVVGILLFSGLNNNLASSKLNSENDLKKMMNSIAKNSDNLPNLETISVDASDKELVSSFTGLKDNSNVLYVVVSEPLISSQAFSAVAVKVKAGSDIEAMKKEMLENINVRKWICVTAEKVYVTNNEDVIFLVMADSDWAKEFYQGFSKYVDNKIGKTLEKTTEEAELPPVIE